ncbi:unnamed protein product, partial [Boreogadus saida]
MVAGMVMPLRDLRTIYELLFRDGVMVAKKDKRPQTKHPEIPGISNLQVMRAMLSLKSRGYVKETYCWRHFYWYLSNEGIVYLRDYLRLPAEIVPASLQRVKRPAAMLPISRRGEQVQTVEGPTSYVPKPGSRPGSESREGLAERQGYRHKMAEGEEEGYSDRTPRFRGRPAAAEPARPRASWETKDQPQQLYMKGRGFSNRDANAGEGQAKITNMSSQQTAAVSSNKPLFTSQQSPVSEIFVGKAHVVQAKKAKDQTHSSTQVTVCESVSSKASLQFSANETKKDKAKEDLIQHSEIKYSSAPLTKKVKEEKSSVENASPLPIKDAEVKAPVETVVVKEKPQKVTNRPEHQEIPKLSEDHKTTSKPAISTQPPREIKQEQREVKMVQEPIGPAQRTTTAECSITRTTKVTTTQGKLNPVAEKTPNKPLLKADLIKEEKRSTIVVAQKLDESPAESLPVKALPQKVNKEITLEPPTSAVETVRKTVDISSQTSTAMETKSKGDIIEKSMEEAEKPLMFSEVSAALEQKAGLLKKECSPDQNNASIVLAEIPAEDIENETSSKLKKKKKKAKMSIEVNLSPEPIVDQTVSKSFVALAAVPPVEIQGTAEVKDKVEGTSFSKVPQGPLYSKDGVTNTNLTVKTHQETSTSETEIVTVTRMETVTVHKTVTVEETLESTKPVEKATVVLSGSKEMIEECEVKAPAALSIVVEESLKGKKRGKAKKQAQARIPATINTEAVSPPAEEPLSSTDVLSLPQAIAPTAMVTGQTDGHPTITPERMCSEEIRQATAVFTEAPADKGEEEPAPLSVKKIKREVPKPKTSSSVREAPAARDLASAEPAVAAEPTGAKAQANPSLKQGEITGAAELHSAAQAGKQRAENKAFSVPQAPVPQDQRKDLKEDTPSVTAIPDFSQAHLVDGCHSLGPEADEANMRRKIVVVEEIIEVKHIAGHQDGAQPPSAAVKPEGEVEEEEELDLDILEELAIERALVNAALPEEDWDHTLEDPEEKSWPNFIEDERDRVQKKTFTKWVNKHLIKSQRHVSDLYEDLRDGHNLISLLEVLSGEHLPREKGRMRFHKLQNVQIALDFLRLRQVKLVNIRNDDIADGNPKLTLGLIWTIILHFQISDIQVNGQSEDMTAKEKLLLWSKTMTENYQGMRCDNFTTSWRDGKLFNAVIHRHQPRLVDMGRVYRQTNLENLEQAFNVAEKDLGVTRLLDPEDVDVAHPDEKSIITYVSSLYDAMPRIPEAQEGHLELRWQEYYELVTLLLQWIQHHITIFGERKFPGSYEEIEILWRQFLKFKETELPAKELDKNRSNQIYQTFESAVRAGQVKVPPGYHPIDVEKEWGRLHSACLDREKLLRIEFERLERLQRIVTKVQMESGVCEEQLNQLDSQMQTDLRLLNSGKPARYTAEVERDLDKADGMIRLLFNDVQFLKDGCHLQSEQIYRRVYRLHERLVNLRTDHNLRQKTTLTTTMHQISQVSQSPKGRPELDGVTLRYAQDLLAWVEENQRRINESEWGSDLPTVESNLGSHRGLHQSVEDFRAKIERAKTDEGQLSPVSKGAYRDYLGKLELQYAKLLNSSKSRLRNLESLNGFVSAATKELMWLNDKEEEEVNFDWSDRNSNMTAKKDNYSGLMRELELREKKINDLQTTGDKLIREGHPGKKTVEAFTAALQTQWSWILQLCCCIEAHQKENTSYYQFFADVKESQEQMRKMQENMKKKYSCDRATTATRLEDLLQDAAEEKEQLNEVKTNVSSLNKRARTIIQLKPRNPTTAIKGKLPIQAACDFKQAEITVHKGDECALLNNSAPFKWKILNRSGNEAVVPSVCFMVPPVNKDAMDSVASLDAGHQQMVTMWQQMHIDMKGLLSWQYLMKDITVIRSWNITMFKSMKQDEYRLMIRNLQLHYQDFLRDSQDSQQFGPDDRQQVEGEYNKTTQYFDNLLTSMEKGEQYESVCKSYTSQLKDLRVRIEDCETHTVNRIRRPLGEEPLKECLLKTSEQKKEHNELDRIKKEVDTVSLKTQEVLSSPQQPASAPTLRSELQVTVQKMDHAHMLSSVYLEKLKTVDVVIRSSQGAEGVLKKYEDKLRDVQTVPNDVKEVETCRAELKKLHAAAESEQPAFESLETELKKASGASDRMSRVHSERDVELDHYHRHLSGLQDRWRAVFTQMDLRHRELEQLGRQLGYYRESYAWLIQWIGDAKQRQEKIQAVSISDSKTLKEQLAQEKKLLEEIENNKDKVDECHNYAKAYIDTIKDYELQLVAYKAQVEPLTSPMKKNKMDSASDDIIQEYVTLRTRYSELMTLTSQYIKFITDTQRRLEDEE